MPRVVLAGVPVDDGAWLQRRLGVPMLSAPTGHAALMALRHLRGGVLVLHDGIADPSAAQVLELAQWQPRLFDLDVVCCLKASLCSELMGHLAAQLGRGHVLFHPVAREDLAREIADALGLVLPPADDTEPADDLAARVGALWQRFSSATLARLSVLEHAARAVHDGTGSTELCRTAEREAHKLAGSMGTFGMHDGSRLALQAEEVLRAGSLGGTEAAQLLELTDAMSRCLHRPPPALLGAVTTGQAGRVRPTTGDAAQQRADVVLVEDDDALAAALVGALQARGHRVHWLKDGRSAAGALAGTSPSLEGRVLVLDADLPGMDGLAVLRTLARDGVLAHSRALVMSSSQDAALASEARALGALDYLPKPLQVPLFTLRVEQELLHAPP